MKITITRKDWFRGISYDSVCGCLLYQAIKRTTGEMNCVWKPGAVRLPDRNYYYATKRIESRLKRAHEDPSLLPITVTLK